MSNKILYLNGHTHTYLYTSTKNDEGLYFLLISMMMIIIIITTIIISD